MIGAVIFDYNGVLIDDEQVHCDLLREVLAEQGIALTDDEYHREYLGYDDRGCFEVALARAGQPAGAERIEELIARKAARYVAAASKGLRIFPGAEACVRAAAGRWPLAVCSGALRAEVEFGLERLGVRHCFCAIVAAEDTLRCKPDPEGYVKALAALRGTSAALQQLQPGECLVIEDSLAGIAAARAAGMPAAAVLHTYPAAQLHEAGATAVAASLAELTPDWIDRTFAAGKEAVP